MSGVPDTCRDATEIRSIRSMDLRIVNWIGELVGSVVPVILLALVIISVGADVIGRNIFSSPIFGVSEVSVLAFVWLVWLGVIGAAKRDELMGVRYFVDLLPPRGKQLVHATTDMMVAIIAAGVIYAAIMQIRTARFTAFMSIDVPKWVMSVGLAISMATIVVIFVARAWGGLKQARSADR
jgi:TRAP-type C4-dicarboxylate transport system permease small subunit